MCTYSPARPPCVYCGVRCGCDGVWRALTLCPPPVCLLAGGGCVPHLTRPSPPVWPPRQGTPFVSISRARGWQPSRLAAVEGLLLVTASTSLSQQRSPTPQTIVPATQLKTMVAFPLCSLCVCLTASQPASPLASVCSGGIDVIVTAV